MSTFDIKKFLINEGMTRVSRDRQRLKENKTKLNEDWNDDDDENDNDDFVPKRWIGLDGKFQMPAGDMSFLAGTGGVYPKEMVSKETEKAAWNAIKNWDTAEFFDFHGIADEELKDWHRENTANTDIDTNWWHCDFSKGSEKATGRYVGFCSDDFMELEDAAENAGWETDESSLDDFLLVLEETADIIVEVGGKDWALVWYLKKLDTLNEDRKDHLPDEPDEPYDLKKDPKRQEEERAKRIHREGMPENTPRQDGLNKNGGHKNNRR